MAVVLALTASWFTAAASVAQRRAAAPAPGDLSLTPGLIGYLLRRPVWFLGIGAMILGFIFQVSALRVGTLSVVQPVVAVELVIVFGFIALRDRSRVQARDWAAAFGTIVGLAGFLTLAHPVGRATHANAMRWFGAAASTCMLAGITTALAFIRFGASKVSSNRRAALLGVAAAIGFGFVAAVVKELSTHLHQGVVGVFSNWSPYVLLLSGAVSMFLASNAFQAGSLAASQPALTLVDPIVASGLGMFLFGERIDLRPAAVLGEVVAVLIVVVSVVALSRSPLIRESHELPRSTRPVFAPMTLGGRVHGLADQNAVGVGTSG